MDITVELKPMKLRPKHFIKSVLDMPGEYQIPIIEGITKNDNISTQMFSLINASRGLLGRDLTNNQLVELTAALEEIMIQLKNKKRQFIKMNK